MSAISLKTRITPPAGATDAGRSSPWLELGLGIIVIAVPLAFLPTAFGPFVGIKLALVVVGVMSAWHGLPRTRTLLLPASAWITAAAVAGATGVDRWWSLVGPEDSGNGLILLAACALLLVVGNAVPTSLRTRIPLWFLGSCAAVSVVALVDRLASDTVTGVLGGLRLDGGATLGQPVFVASLMAAGVAAAAGLERLRMPTLVGALVLFSTVLALTGKRVGWVAVAVGLAVVLWRARPTRQRAIVIVATVAITLGAWSAVDAVAPLGKEAGGARRFSQLTSGSARARMQYLPGLGRAWRKRPLLGWGPGNTWSAHLASAKTSELQFGERGLGDAHNLVMESAVTTGIVGLIPFLLLAGITARLLWRGARSLGWAAGVAAALGVSHLLQPMNLSLTPMLFLFAGLACRAPPDLDAAPGARVPTDGRGRMATRLTRIALGLLVAAALSLSMASLASSALEGYGKKYAEEWALRASTRIAPWRISAAEALALHLAFDGRYGDVQAAEEAVALATETVRRHPWNPGVRLAAADVYLLLRDHQTADMWIMRQRAVFPADPVLPGGVQDPRLTRTNGPV